MQKIEEQKYNQPIIINQIDDDSNIINLIVGSLSGFRKDRLVQILKDNGLDHFGEKDNLLQLLQISLYKKQVDIENIKERILSWEIWSRRHTYFFEIDGKIPTADEVKKSISIEYANLVNNNRKFRVPFGRQVESIFIDDNVVRIFMNESALVEVREESEDEYNNGIRKKAYRVVQVRKVFYFELNLKTGAVFISIPAIQTHGKYPKELESVLNTLRKILPNLVFVKVQIRKSILAVRALDNITNKGLDVNVGGTLTAALRMKNKKSLTDKEVPKEVTKIINDGYLEEGIFEVDDLDSKSICSMRIYKDSRLGIFKDLDEDEYRYVCELVAQQPA